MTLDSLEQQELTLLKCISGSRAYGLDTPQSDTDIKGVFMLPREQFYSLEYIPQIANPTNDIVFFELGRFVELLTVNNPNILELLNSPQRCVQHRHPIMDLVRPEDFVSKLCLNTFGRFAESQIRKARGLNKKIMKPMSRERKSVLEFCYVTTDKGSKPLTQFLEKKGWQQADCGLVNLAHMKDLYGLYHDPGADFSGIVRGANSNEVALSSIPKDLPQAAVLYFNQDGYSRYCKDHKAYWDWVENRNEVRFESTQAHGKKYDAKNMMHTFRLLDMAIEIAETGSVQVERPNRDFLLDIKSGAFEYDELLELAQQRMAHMEEAFSRSSLPEKPDEQKANQILVAMRESLYL